MPERYTVSTRGAKTPQHDQKTKSKTTNGLSASTLPTSYLVITAMILIIATNILTYLITVSIYNKRVADLGGKVAQLQQGSNQAQKTANTNNNSPGGGTSTVPSDARNAVQAAIDGKNYGSLTDRLASTVTFAVAGSSTTQQSPQQVLASLAALQGASGGWNWNIPPSLLQQLQQGSNAQYFGSNSVVGQSGNGYIVAATVGSNGQITSIFISPSSGDAGVNNTGGQGSE